MRHFNHILSSIAIAAILGFFVTSARAQAPVYYGPLLFSMPRDTSVPPVYLGQPPTVTTGYLWLDGAMRLYPEAAIESFFNSLSWGDTMKTFASVLYQTQDDNPLSLFLWSGTAMNPNPYKGNPGQAQVAFEKRISRIATDTGRTSSLLTADIIADVIVSDTICVTDPTAYVAHDMVFVNSTILDEIKGKQIPLCVGEGMLTYRKNKGSMPQDSSAAIPWATYAVPANSGTCLQFEYSPEWALVQGDDEGRTRLIDPSGGWWIKPGKEYIVFLNCLGISCDKTTDYFTVRPGIAAIGSCGMYPVVGGIVQDPHDDYGIGASSGLTVAVWKSRLRERISAIVTP